MDPKSVHTPFFDAASPDIRERLVAIQSEVIKRIPDAIACVSYRMPAFRLSRVFFYFAAFKAHIGIYPPVREPQALIKLLEPFRGPKGNLSFPHHQALPLDLIGQMAEALVKRH
ncbi:iron chaperone [Candidatus Phycosocius spiralis]|uniref:YdhG-like domain-containing protein n=1 Tax=Candidatus Phycosocius spiralis TaxID=2815099 RepID=A0ABQ4PTY5_9PROT|nr:hypothetical protein [Candidatus Phycosocius spiralis]GIU66476.1 hypothetical protein PsB1_0630 [Candidatus Phycosocius spiralis]